MRIALGVIACLFLAVVGGFFTLPYITESLLETIKRELPALLRSDPALRRFILDLTRETYADRRQTEDRFDRILDELRRDREQQARRWDEENRKWDEQSRGWEEQNRTWKESSDRFDRLHEEIMAQAQKHDRSVGALGSMPFT